MLKNISSLKGVKKLDKNLQKSVNGGRTKICGGTGATPISWEQARCLAYGVGVEWRNGQCYACH